MKQGPLRRVQARNSEFGGGHGAVRAPTRESIYPSSGAVTVTG